MALMIVIPAASASNRCKAQPHVCNMVKTQSGCEHSYEINSGNYQNCSWTGTKEKGKCHGGGHCHMH